MRLRSAQFVLLVLLLSSLGLSEGSSLRLADELIGSANGILLSQQAAARTTLEVRSTPSDAATPIAHQALPPAHHDTLARAWTMPHPAAQAAALQATSANARA